jgi:hypothetical protein
MQLNEVAEHLTWRVTAAAVSLELRGGVVDLVSFSFEGPEGL